MKHLTLNLQMLDYFNFNMFLLIQRSPLYSSGHSLWLLKNVARIILSTYLKVLKLNWKEEIVLLPVYEARWELLRAFQTRQMRNPCSRLRSSNPSWHEPQLFWLKNNYSPLLIIYKIANKNINQINFIDLPSMFNWTTLKWIIHI